MMSSMGMTCSSKTAREVIKTVGTNCDKLARRILEFQRTVSTFQLPEVTREVLTPLLDNLMAAPYLFFGRNRIPHKFVLNGEITKKFRYSIHNIYSAKRKIGMSDTKSIFCTCQTLYNPSTNQFIAIEWPSHLRQLSIQIKK